MICLLRSDILSSHSTTVIRVIILGFSPKLSKYASPSAQSANWSSPIDASPTMLPLDCEYSSVSVDGFFSGGGMPRALR